MSIEGIPVVPEKQEELKYRVAWKSKLTGATGHGEYMDKGKAQVWLESVKKSTPDLVHWLEPEGENN